MNKQQIEQSLKAIHNGAYTKIRYLSTIPSNKENKGKVVQKMTDSIVRLGVTYCHIAVPEIQDSIKNNDSAKRELPWGQWDEQNPNYLIEHKGNYYLRCSTSRSPNHHGKVRYFVDGAEVSKEEAMSLTRPSEWTDARTMYVFNPKIENILAIGKEVK